MMKIENDVDSSLKSSNSNLIKLRSIQIRHVLSWFFMVCNTHTVY